jgi:hypothetical protein
MFFKAKEGVTEEDYYLSEWNAEERAQVRGGCNVVGASCANCARAPPASFTGTEHCCTSHDCLAVISSGVKTLFVCGPITQSVAHPAAGLSLLPPASSSQGMHMNSLKFAYESRSQRGVKVQQKMNEAAPASFDLQATPATKV